MYLHCYWTIRIRNDNCIQYLKISLNIWIWPKMKCSSWFFLEKYTGTFQTEAGTSRIWHEEKKWNKIQIICVTSRTEVIWGHEWVCEWLIQDVWRTSSQSLEILIRLKRLSWTVRPIGWLPHTCSFLWETA